jgi:hypothetical protein
MNALVQENTRNEGNGQGYELDNGGRVRRENNAWIAARWAPRARGKRLVGGVTRLLHDLRLVLVEIETGVEPGLLCKEIFDAGFVLEGATELGPVIGEGLFVPLNFMVFVLGAVIQKACPPMGGLTVAAAAHPKVGDRWKAA